MHRFTLAFWAIASLPLVAAADSKPSTRFTSETTPLYPSKKCKAIVSSEETGSDPVLRCPARRDFDVEVNFSAWATHVSLTGPSTKLSFDGYVGDHIEWRLADGKPFAVIVSVDEKELQYDEKADPKSRKLQVRGVNGWKIQGDVQADAKNAVKQAQDLADAAYLQAQPRPAPQPKAPPKPAAPKK